MLTATFCPCLQWDRWKRAGPGEASPAEVARVRGAESPAGVMRVQGEGCPAGVVRVPEERRVRWEGAGWRPGAGAPQVQGPGVVVPQVQGPGAGVPHGVRGPWVGMPLGAQGLAHGGVRGPWVEGPRGVPGQEHGGVRESAGAEQLSATISLTCKGWNSHVTASLRGLNITVPGSYIGGQENEKEKS